MGENPTSNEGAKAPPLLGSGEEEPANKGGSTTLGDIIVGLP